jgi:hypothetical protein
MLTLPFPISHSAFAYGRPLVQSGVIQLANAVSTNWTTICAETLTQVERAIISAIGVDIDDNGTVYDFALASIAYKLSISQGAAQDWGGNPEITSKRGSVIHPTQTFIRVEPGQQIQLQARRIAANDNGLRNVNGLFSGVRWNITINKDKLPTDGPLDSELARSLPHGL